MNVPMREKYVDEAIGVFSIFGTHSDGSVDVSDGNRDVFEYLPLDIALAIVELQTEFRHKMYELLCEGMR